MEFNKLREYVINDINKRFENNLLKVNASEEELKNVLSFERKHYKGTIEQQKKKLINHLEQRKQKEINNRLTKLKEVEQAEDFKGEFIITIEWKKSRMWGANPKVYTNYGFTSESISGCGYDKESTATAQALNSHKPILKELFKKKELYLNNTTIIKDNTDIHREIFGYGSGYGILPNFEGGVGSDCHRRILETLKMTMEHISNTKSTDVYLIKRID